MSEFEHKVFKIHNEKGHANITITFPNGKTLSIGFGEWHYASPTTAEVAIWDENNNKEWLTQKYIREAGHNVAGWVNLGTIVHLIVRLFTEE